MSDLVTVTGPTGESVTVQKGQRYYKPGGNANIRAESPTDIRYENRRGEESVEGPAFFLRKYQREGYRSPYSFGA